MNQSRLQRRVGLFVFISLVLLGWLLLQFSKGLTMFQSNYDILLQAASAGSLKPKAQVLMSGVQVGTIADIQLDPSGKHVTMTLRILNKYRVYKDARFVIEQSGFLGDQYVAIIPTENQGEVFHNQDTAQAETPFNIQEMARSATGFVQRMDETARRLNETLGEVRKHLLNQETLTNLAVSAANLRMASERAVKLVDNLDELVTTNSPALGHAGTNLMVFSEQLNQFANRLNEVLATNAPALNQTVKNVESSSAMLKSAMEDVQAGKGLAGALLRNEQVAENMTDITRNLSITSSNLNRLGLWGILWQHRPPKTNPPPKVIPSPKYQQ